jgi:hypothetical protein
MNLFLYYSETDQQLGKVLKCPRPNPVGENMYLRPDGTIDSEEAKIVRAQQIFKHNYYKPGGTGAKRALEKYVSRPGNESSILKQN